MLTSNLEREFVRETIDAGTRCDGRQLFDYRKVQIHMLPQRGCLELALGDTKVLAKTKAEIIQPRSDRPSEGVLTFRVDTQIKGEDSKKISTEISKLLQKIIKGSNALDPQSLCITNGKCVWSVTVEAVLMADDGNLVDAVEFAVILALLDFRKPGLTVEKDEVKINKKQNQQSLSIHHIPITFTFGLMKTGAFLDPHRREENAYQGRVTVAMNVYKDICSIHKPGGIPIQQKTLMQIIEICQLKIGEFTNLMRGVVQNREKYLLVQ